MWQFSGSIDGMAAACRALGIPVIGGNVSFYNESRGRDIDPTPIVGVVGVIDDLADPPPPPRSPTATPSCCSARRGRRSEDRNGRRATGSAPAPLRPSTSTPRWRCTTSCARWCTERAVQGVHDCADGGLAVAVAEMAIAGDIGAQARARAPGGSSGSRSRRHACCCRCRATGSTRCWHAPPTPGVPAARDRDGRRRPARGAGSLRRGARQPSRRHGATRYPARSGTNRPPA